MKPLLLLLSCLSLCAEVVTWDASPSAATDGVIAYRVYYSTNFMGPFTLLVEVPSTARSATNSAPGRFYYYATAFNGSESEPSNIAFRPGNPGGAKVK